MDNLNPICKRFKEVRGYIGFKKPIDFAKELEVNYTTYLNYEKKIVPPFRILLKIHEKYPIGLDFHWLLTGEGQMIRKNVKEDPDWPTIQHEKTESDEDDQPPKRRRSSDKTGKKDTREGILEQFNDREAARKINLTMAEMEQKNPICIGKIEAYIRGMESMLNNKSEKK